MLRSGAPVSRARARRRWQTANCPKPPSPRRSPVRLPDRRPARSAPAEGSSAWPNARINREGDLGRHRGWIACSFAGYAPASVTESVLTRTRWWPGPIDVPDRENMRDQAGSTARVVSIILASDAGLAAGCRLCPNRRSVAVDRRSAVVRERRDPPHVDRVIRRRMAPRGRQSGPATCGPRTAGTETRGGAAG